MARLLSSLALAVACLAGWCASASHAAEPTLALSDRITGSFSKPAEMTDGERPLASFALKFTRDANRLEDSSSPTEVEPTLVEELIDVGFPTGVGGLHLERKSTSIPVYAWTLATVVRKPESDPRFISGKRLEPIEGVAMRFRDEFTFASGVTYSR